MSGPNRPSVSLCMIVKDEAPRLEGCVLPLLPLVDELVVVDTGSADDTVAVARRLGARVLRRRWRESFAQARNVSLSAAQGDWLLVVDADERIDGQNRRKLAALLPRLGTCNLDAFRFRVLNWWCEGAQRELSKFLLFRNHPAIRYRGRVHETVRPALEKMGARMADSGIVLHHRGDLRSLTEAVAKDLEYQRLRSGSRATALEQLLGPEERLPRLDGLSSLLASSETARQSLAHAISRRAREGKRLG